MRAPRTLPESPAPRGGGASAPRRPLDSGRGCSADCPALGSAPDAPPPPYLLEKGPRKTRAAGGANAGIRSGCAAEGERVRRCACAAVRVCRGCAGPLRPGPRRARGGRDARSRAGGRLATAAWSLVGCARSARLRDPRPHSPLPARPAGRRARLQVSGAPPASPRSASGCPAAPARMPSPPPCTPARVVAPGLLPPSFPRFHALRPRLSLLFLLLRSSPLGSHASRFADNLSKGLTRPTFAS